MNQSHVNRLRTEIENHLSILKDLELNLLPKHHFMTHYPTIIQEMGPLTNMCMLKFERKHKILKSFMADCSNYTNITSTITRKHQEYLTVVSTSYEDEIISGVERSISVSLVESNDHLFSEEMMANMLEVKFIKQFNNYYRECLFVYHNDSFDEIQKILKINNEFHFICLGYKVTRFDKFLNSFEIQKMEGLNSKLIRFDDLDSKNVHEKKILDGKEYIICNSLLLAANLSEYNHNT